jgi:hypothetical protein
VREKIRIQRKVHHPQSTKAFIQKADGGIKSFVQKGLSSMEALINHPRSLSSIEASKNSFKGVHHPWRHQIIHPKWPIILGGITTFIQKDQKRSEHLSRDQKHHPNHVS